MPSHTLLPPMPLLPPAAADVRLSLLPSSGTPLPAASEDDDDHCDDAHDDDDNDDDDDDDDVRHCPHPLTPISPPNPTSAPTPACITLPS